MEGKLAPKGQKNLAQGFNPGYFSKKCQALPVRRSSGPWDEGGKVAADRRVASPACSGAAFRAHRIKTIYPGLKPWAESFCPFGALIT